MSNTWQEYQEQAAAFFRNLGFEATVDCKVEGVRGTHNVDVLVEGSLHGIPVKWIIECKAWTSNVPKEKAMALLAIVQDAGADRGFLLSEKGFQSGAIRASRKTNLTLTSLADLEAATEEHFVDSTIARLNWRLHKAQIRLREIKKRNFDDMYFPPTMEILGELGILSLVLDDAVKNEYPFIYMRDRLVNSLDELARDADALLTRAETWEPPDT